MLTRGSVGTGRRARLRILCIMLACGFKSHLPHVRTAPQACCLGCCFFMRKETEPSGFCLLGAKRLRRSVRWEKDPPDLFLFPPHPIFRMIVLPGVLFFHAEGDRTQWVLSPRREAPASVGSTGKGPMKSFDFFKKHSTPSARCSIIYIYVYRHPVPSFTFRRRQYENSCMQKVWKYGS